MSPAANPPAPAATIVIVGAGLAGLSAAWELTRAGRADVVLLEASDRAGGVVASEARDGFLLEHGPDSFLARKPEAAALCAELGLSAEIVSALPPGGARILRRGRLRPLPGGWRMIAPSRLLPVLASPLFPLPAKAALAARWWSSPPAAPPEESVAGFLRRRFGLRAGQALADIVAGPLLAGVYGGDAEALDIAALLPPPAPPAAAPPPSPFASLRAGMGALVEALAARLPAGALRLGCPVRSIASLPSAMPAGARFRIEFESGVTLSAAAVLLAVPAWSAATLLAGLDPALAVQLAAIPYASSVNLNLAYAAAPTLPPGSGFLVPRTEGYRLLACTFAHQKFPHRAPPGAALLRLFYPGELLDWPPERLESFARRELRAILGIDAPPDFIRIGRAPRALAQYTVGHPRRLQSIAAALARHPGLRLAGNAYQGVGVPDCIASGRAAATALLADLGRGTTPR